MPHKVEGFACDFCRRHVYRLKGSAVRHEKGCPENPAVKACKICLHLIVEHPSISDRNEFNAPIEYGCELGHDMAFLHKHCPDWTRRITE
jgi:hypothetical protein